VLESCHLYFSVYVLATAEDTSPPPSPCSKRRYGGFHACITDLQGAVAFGVAARTRLCGIRGGREGGRQGKKRKTWGKKETQDQKEKEIKKEIKRKTNISGLADQAPFFIMMENPQVDSLAALLGLAQPYDPICGVWLGASHEPDGSLLACEGGKRAA